MTNTQIQSVPYHHGSLWISAGWKNFKAAPGLWITLIIVMLLPMFVMNIINSNLGSLVNTLLWPVFYAGIMLACADQAKGKGLKVETLFAAFQTHLTPLIQLGILNLLCIALCLLVTGVVGLILFLSFNQGDINSLMSSFGNLSKNPQSLGMEILLIYFVLILFFAAIYSVAMLGSWFAPGLIVFRNMSAGDAFVASLRACLKNIWPISWFGLMTCFWMFLACFTFGLGFLVIIPVIQSASYAAFMDLFPELTGFSPAERIVEPPAP